MTKFRLTIVVLLLFVTSKAFAFIQLLPYILVVAAASNGVAAVACAEWNCLSPSGVGTTNAVSVQMQPSGSSGPTVRVALTADLNKLAQAMPAPTPTTTPSPTTTPGMDMNAQYWECFSNSPLPCGGPYSASTAATFASQHATNGYIVPYTGGSAPSSGAPSGTCYGSNSGCAPTNPSNTCPTGWTYQNGVCNLSDARAAVKDNNVDVLYTAGSGFSFGSDADAASASEYVKVSNGNLTVWGQDSAGRPTVTTFSSSSSGGYLMTVQTQETSAGGQSIVNTAVYGFGSGGGLVSSGASLAPGTISASTSPSTPPTVATNGSVSPTEQQQFPTDYARTGEAAAAANSVNQHIDQLNKTMSDTSATLGDPLVPGSSSFDAGWFGNSFDSLTAWRLPAHSSQCPVWDFDLAYFSRHYTMDAQCTIAEQVKPTFSIVMVVVWVLGALFIVMGA